MSKIEQVTEIKTQRWVNIYQHKDGSRSISDEDYDSYIEAFENRDALSIYVDTVRLCNVDDTLAMTKAEEKPALERLADEFEDIARRIRVVSSVRNNHTNSDVREAVAQTWERAACLLSSRGL